MIRAFTDGKTPTVTEVGYDDLPLRVVKQFADGGDRDAQAWLDAHPLVASGDWDESKHPRDHGRFAEKEGDSGEAKVLTGKALRDQLADQYVAKFKEDLGDYPERYNAAEPGNRPVSENPAQDIWWRGEERAITAYDRALLRASADPPDSRALGTIRANVTRELNKYGSDDVRPEALATMHEAVAALNADPDARALMDRYGTPTVMPATTMPGLPADSMDIPSGNFNNRDTIRLFENAFERAGDVYPTHGDLRPGGATVSSQSRLGTLTHEFGHFIDSKLTDEQHAEWKDLYSARQSSWARDMDASNSTYESRQAAGDRTVSFYAMNSGRGGASDLKEGFAETFAAVMHPDYDRSKFDESNHPMLDFVEGIVKDAHK